MEYIYAVMLLNKAGKEVTEEAVTKVLTAAGVEVDGAKVKSLIAALDGVDIDKVIEENSMAMSAVPSAPTASAAPAAAAPEKKEEAPVVDASAGLGSLF